MASKFMLCSFKTCPWVQRAAIVLQAKQIPYDITYIDRDNRPAWFLAISPHSKVPVLQIDGKEALFESNAIAEYLEEVAQPAPASGRPDRAGAQSRVDRLRDRRSHPPMSERGVFRIRNRSIAANAAKISGPFGKLEEALAKRGNRRALFQRTEDVARRCGLRAVPPALHVHGSAEVRSASSSKFPLLAAWRDALIAAPAVKCIDRRRTSRPCGRRI